MSGRNSGAAVRIVFGRPPYLAAALLIAVGSGAFLVWSSGIVTIFPTGGVFIDADLVAVATIVATAVLLGASVPLHWYAWRRSAGSARARGVGGLAAVLSIGSLSCCAPLLIPGVLSLVGVSGTSILAVTVRLHAWRLPLFLGAVLLLAISLVTGLRGAVKACRLPPDAGSGRSPAHARQPRST